MTKKSTTILVIEDESTLREIITATLTDSGYKTLEAADGKEGLETAIAQRPDLILLDLLMPVMNGIEMLRTLRQSSWGSDVPVMILTNLSTNDEKLIEELIDQKPVCYLTKSSWTMRNIVAKIEEVL